MKKILLERFRQEMLKENPDMKASDGKQNKNRKWSIKDCDDKDGWKLKDVRRKQVKAESLEGAKIMREIYTTNFDSKFHDRYWRVEDIYLVENDKLKSQFEDYKNELTALGRPSGTVTETVVFSAESEKSCKDICQDGYKVGSKKRHVLGHTGSGVHLVRHYDILTRYLMFQQYTSPAYIIVYKTFLGKTKPIVPRLHKDDNYVPPYSGFDSHVSARHVDKDMPICEALNCSYVYLYEVDQISSNPVKYPRQILPYAIIQLEKKVPSVPESPFLAVGSDETRSTWEVKGETRRGFRFMFTKSGLKGKHKDFTKAFSRENMGSYLKGQILEMRTKSTTSMNEAKPPLLLKIDDSNLTNTRTEDSLDTSKPPNLQKFTSKCTQSPSKKEKFTLGTEIENLVIPKSVRDILQLSNYKPVVKLKRLDSNLTRRTRVKSDIKNDNSKEKTKTIDDSSLYNSASSVRTLPETKISSGKVNTPVSEFISLSSESDKSGTSNNRQNSNETQTSGCKNTELENSESRMKASSISDETRTDKEAMTISKQKGIGPGKCRKTKENCIQMTNCIKTAVRDETVTGTNTPSDKSAPENTAVRNETCHSMETKTVSPPTSNSRKTKLKDTKNVDKEKLPEVKEKVPSLRLNKRLLDKKPVVLTVKVTESKNSSVLIPSYSGVNDSHHTPSGSSPKKSSECKKIDNDNNHDSETQTGIQITQVNLKADVKETGKKAEILKNKNDTSYCTLKSLLYSNEVLVPGDIQTADNTTLGKDAPIQTVSENKECFGIRSTTESRDKHTMNTRRIAEQKTDFEKQKTKPPYSLDKEKNIKKLSARLSPTKTKFGRVVYTIMKNKRETCRKYKNGDNISGNHSENLRTMETSNECKEYDFFVRDQPLNREKNSLKCTLTENEKNEQQGTVEKCGETNDSGNACLKMSSSTSSSDIEGKSILNNTDNFEACPAHSETCKHTSVDERLRKTVTDKSGIIRESSCHNQSIVLEKSKSPDIANAAPDILNISPVLVSAQISTSPYSERVVTFQNNLSDNEKSSQKENHREMPEKSHTIYKKSIFLSEMSSFYANRNNVKSLGLIEHFPEPLTQTHIVSPVLRATVSNEIPFKSLDETKHPENAKMNKEETVSSERNHECDATIKHFDPRNGGCTKQTEDTSETKSMETKALGRQTNKPKSVGVGKLSKTMSKTTSKDRKHKQKRSYKSTDVGAALCGPVVPSKKQNHAASVPPVPVSNNIPNENILNSQSCKKRNKIVETKTEIMLKQSCENKLKAPVKNVDMDTVKEKQVNNIQVSHTLASDVTESSNSYKETKLLSPSFRDKGIDKGPGQKTDDNNDFNKLETKVACEGENTTEIAHVNDEDKQSNNEMRNTDRITKDKPDACVPVDNGQVICTNESKLNSTKPLKRRSHSDSSENANNVKVDTLTADRLRSFLSTTAAVAIQRKKSVDQKSDTSTDDNTSIGTPMNDSDYKCLKTDSDSTSKEKSGYETHLEVEEDTPHCNLSTMKTSMNKARAKEALPKEPIKESKLTFIKQNRRRDSAEMHDNDSQDTVIGGVTYVTYSPLRQSQSDFSNQNANLKHFETFLTQLSPEDTQSDVASNIKQEKENDGYKEQTVTSTAEKDTSHNSDPATFINTVRNNHEDNTILEPFNHECQNKTMTMENEVKQEPVGVPIDNSHILNSNDSFETHSVKTESCYHSNFFPRTREELAKGAAMLSATDCRSAIVDTLRELSSVLKILTESNISGAKQSEKVALVAKEMCNVLSGEKSTSTISDSMTRQERTDTSNSDNLDVQIKREPDDNYEYQNIPELNVQDSKITSHGYTHHSKDEKQNYNHDNISRSEEGFKYEYILKTSDDEHQTTCEIEPSPTFVLESTKEKLKNEAQDAMQRKIKGAVTVEQSSEQEEAVSSPEHEYEIDALPRLFDPNEEADITYLEDFGIPCELCMNENKTTETKSIEAERHLSEKTVVVDNVSNAGPFAVNELLTDIKTEKNAEESLVKPKPKQSFNFKTGLLNKGLRERKNMFDLKINSFRRKPPATVVDKKLAVRLERANAQIPTESDCVTEKAKEFKSCSEDNDSTLNRQKQQDSVVKEVYKTVCEKLLTLKGKSSTEDTVSKPLLSPSTKQDLCNNSKSLETKGANKDLQPEEDIPKDTDKTCTSSAKCEQAAVKHSEVSTLSEKTNVTKHSIIPFKTVIKLKKRQYLKYKKGESNKKFIDYSEISPEMYKQRVNQSCGKTTDQPKTKTTVEQQSNNLFKKKIEKNEHLGKSLNYLIPSCKTSNISNRGTALIEDSNRSVNDTEGKLLKRQSTDADERTVKKRIKISSDENNRSEPRSDRSRSKSSHQSSETGRHRSREHSSQFHNEKTRSSGNDRKYYNGPIRSHFISKGNYNFRPFSAAERRNRKFRKRSYSTQAHGTSNQCHGQFGKSSFNRSGTGYFSWRRKYQPRRNIFDGFVVTNKGSVQTVAEYAEWTRFKERESLRDQIENAIKEYKRTFEHTPGDKKGDEKVASYLNYLTEKIDKIQDKRDKLNMSPSRETRYDKHKRSDSVEKGASQKLVSNKEIRSELIGKLEKSQNFHTHETMQHASVSRFSGSLASDSDSLSYKQRRHASGIEELLKEHIHKHCEHLTKQIKQEISKEIEERKILPPSSTASTSKKDHTDRTLSRDFDRSKYSYERKNVRDRYRSLSRERYDSKRAGTERDFRRHYDKYDSKRKDYEKKYDRDSQDKYDKGRYKPYIPRLENKHEIMSSHRDIYARSHDSYRKHHDSENELKYRKDYYYGSKHLTTLHESKSRYEHIRDRDYTKTYDYQQNYDKYQVKYNEHFQNIKADTHKNKYQADNAQECAGHKNISKNSKYNRPKSWYKGKYNKYYNKSDNKSNYRPQDKTCENDGEVKVEHVLDEFDATQYRQFIPSFSKKRRGFFKGISKRSYQPAKFSRIRNPITYFNHDDKDKGKDAKTASNLEKTPNIGTSADVLSFKTEKDTFKGLSFMKSKEPKPIPIVCVARQTTTTTTTTENSQ